MLIDGTRYQGLPPTDEPTTPPSPNPLKQKIMPVLAGLFLVAAIGSATAAYNFYNDAQELKRNPQKVAQDETKLLLEQIGKLIVLPADEQPTVATVADPEKLKDQPFFAKAQRGDRVLIYTRALKAILYDPIANRIVEVAPVSIGTTAQTAQTAGAATDTTNPAPPGQ